MNIIGLLIFIVGLTAVTAAYTTSTIKYVHYFQLNSYQLQSHYIWMKRNKKMILKNIVLGIICALLFYYNSILAFALAVIASFASAFWLKPQKAKKPLVYTMRVKRFICTMEILYAIIFLIGFLLNFNFIFAAIALMLNPFIIVLAAVINEPIENGVKNYYINDAKRMLGAANNLKVIGITGSYGKTSVKYYLNTLLKSQYNVLMTPESFNTPMGVVKTIRESLNASHEFFICEMGARHVGDIKEICDIVNPRHGIITSIGPQHLETFKTLDNIKSTKYELADAVGENGYLFLNTEDENVYSNINGRKHISYSISKNSDYKAHNITASSMGTSFEVTAPNGEACSYTTHLIGKHNVINVLGAIAAAHTLGIPLEKLKGAVRRLESVPHRLELKDKGTIAIIDDAYNANPSGTKAALETLALFDGYKIMVTPGMVELGEKMDECNAEFGRNATEVCDYIVLVGKKQTQSILNGLHDKGYSDSKIFVADTIAQAIEHVYQISSDGKKKYVLLENDLPDNYIN